MGRSGRIESGRMLLWIIGFSLLGSVGAIAGAALLLLFPDGIRRTLVPSLVSYAKNNESRRIVGCLSISIPSKCIKYIVENISAVAAKKVRTRNIQYRRTYPCQFKRKRSMISLMVRVSAIRQLYPATITELFLNITLNNICFKVIFSRVRKRKKASLLPADCLDFFSCKMKV